MEFIPIDVIEEICLCFRQLVKLASTNHHFRTICKRLMRKPCYDGDRCLKLLPMFLDATSLNLYSVRRPSTEYLLQMTSLRSLCLGRTREITNHCLSQLTALTNLDLTANEYITDAGLITLTNLKILDLHANQIITTNCILKLTSLTALNLCWSNISVYRVVKEMTSLQHLSIQKYQHDPHWVTRHSLKIQVLHDAYQDAWPYLFHDKRILYL